MKTSHTILWNIAAILLVGAVLVTGAWSIYYYDSNTELYPHKSWVMGNHEIVNTTSKLGQFTRLSVNGNFRVRVTPGDTAQITLQADSNILPLIEVGIMDGKLNIHVPNRIILHPTAPLTIVLTAPILDQISLSGTTQLTAQQLNTSDLTISLSGTSKATISGAIQNLVVNLGGASALNAHTTNANSIALVNGGSGNVTLSGNTRLLTITSGGTTSINAKQLVAQQVIMTAAGTSHVAVNVLDSLDVTATGNSEIQYSGHPQSVSKTGFGDIRLFPVTT